MINIDGEEDDTEDTECLYNTIVILGINKKISHLVKERCTDDLGRMDY